MTHQDLEKIYQDYYEPLFLFAFSLTSQKEDAEDLVANAFVKAFLSFRKGNIKAWLYTVLKNEFYNMYKKRKIILDENQMDISLMKDKFDFIEQYIYDEKRRWLYQQIYALDIREQQIMLLSLQDDLNDQEIADIMNLKVEHIRVIRNRVKNQLKEKSKEVEL